MKKIILLLTVALLLCSVNVIGQSVSFTVTATAPTCSACCNGSFTVSMSGCTSYTVFTTGLGAPTSFTGGGAVYSNVCNGTYSVTVLGNAPCNSAVQVCSVSYSTAGIESVISNKENLIIYPNPTSGQFFIETNTNEKLSIDLYDLNGRNVFSASVNDKSNIDVSALNEGVYTLTIKTANSVTNKKLVILR